jgi:hypothetical protein
MEDLPCCVDGFYSSLIFAKSVVADYKNDYVNLKGRREEDLWLKCLETLITLLGKIHDRARAKQRDLTHYCRDNVHRRWVNEMVDIFDNQVESFCDSSTRVQEEEFGETEERRKLLEELYSSAFNFTYFICTLPVDYYGFIGESYIGNV